MIKRRLVALAMLVSPCLVAGGCSLVNSFGDVIDDGGVANDASTNPDHTAPPPNNDAGFDATSPIDSPVTIEAAADTSSPPPSDSGGPDAADAADAGPLGPVGALVVGGVSSADGGFTLTTIDPTTGHELAPSLREAMTVVGIHYDGLRDLWYIFENTGIGGVFPAPADKVYLHVRQLDTHSGAWTELAKIVVPALVSTDTVAVLNGRLAYTGYVLNDAGSPTGGYQMYLVDTTTPGSPAMVNPPMPLASAPTSTIGTRNPSNTGGTINLFHIDQTQCQGDGSAEVCAVVVVHVTVQSTGGPVASPGTDLTTAANPQGSEGVASFLSGGPDDVIAFPAANGKPAQIQRFSSLTSAFTAGSTVSFGSGDIHLENLAISECYATAFVVGVPSDTQLYGVPLLGQTSTVMVQDLGHAGQAVEFEPYTSSVITPFKANGSFALGAYLLSGTASAPILQNRATLGTWAPPNDLEPNFVAVRQPIPFTCAPH